MILYHLGPTADNEFGFSLNDWTHMDYLSFKTLAHAMLIPPQTSSWISTPSQKSLTFAVPASKIATLNEGCEAGARNPPSLESSSEFYQDSELFSIVDGRGTHALLPITQIIKLRFNSGSPLPLSRPYKIDSF